MSERNIKHSNPLALRCILSFVVLALLYGVCVGSVPLYYSEYGGPVIPSREGKLVSLVIAVSVLIRIWTFGGSDPEPAGADESPDSAKESGQELLREADGKSVASASGRPGIRSKRAPAGTAAPPETK